VHGGTFTDQGLGENCQKFIVQEISQIFRHLKSSLRQKNYTDITSAGALADSNDLSEKASLCRFGAIEQTDRYLDLKWRTDDFAVNVDEYIAAYKMIHPIPKYT
jgi:hypothetical protein